METGKSQKSSKILIIILILVVFSLVGYIAYDKLIKDENGTEYTTQNDNQMKPSNVADTKYILPKRKSILSISGTDSQLYYHEKVNNFKCGSLDEGKYATSPLSVIVDTKGDAYLKVDCMKGTNDSASHEDETNAFIKILEENNNIKFSKYNITSYGEITAYKLPISNVATAYNMYFATGGGYYFVFILNDGKVSAMNDNEIISSGKINTTTFNNLNNILYVTDCGMHGANCEPFAVDNKGEEIYLLTYFSKWFNDYRD